MVKRALNDDSVPAKRARRLFRLVDSTYTRSAYIDPSPAHAYVTIKFKFPSTTHIDPVVRYFLHNETLEEAQFAVTDYILSSPGDFKLVDAQLNALPLTKQLFCHTMPGGRYVFNVHEI
ncbi:hypothetical protein SARC_05688 [Sphaeroforma arctica JP610]|uniref:Uncharacterized protein n=1 Tax=Sphaeroforma arctica JP610 TaxID=667725 RepID=A0A0L0G1E8_9EUKA|nr:hypothetical protein SARC_05688 [Sphaeroforma arctica JP610]KNC82028.1 hypothetical protein SARC_05688 [Sphaeroforma arctica JP610]|eukprot:XP_014155930.1 hypothetical protein SARC_05688 [Sphaeroforma arctica JP610]